MIRLFGILSLLFILACTESNLEKGENTSIAIDTSMYGIWINTDYLENVKTTKSPYVVSLKTPYQFLFITKEQAVNDTLKITWQTQNTSEFTGYNCYKPTSKNKFVYIGYSSEAELPSLNKQYTDSLLPAHTLLFKEGDIVLKNSREQEIKRYVLLTKNMESNYFQLLTQIVTKRVIAGKYKELNTEKTFTFSPDGKVMGFDKYDTFDVNIFFSEEYGMFTHDFIELSYTNMERKDGMLENKLMFQFSHDTLRLYEFYNDSLKTGTYFKPTPGKLFATLKKI